MCRRWIALTHSALFLGQSYPNFTDRMYVFHDAKLQIAFSSRLLMLFLRCCNYGRGTAQSVLNRMQNAPLNYKYSAWKVLSHFLRACWQIGLCWEMASKACLVVCVCVFLSENGDILFQKDSREIRACLAQQTPAHCWFVGWWVQRHFMASMGSYLVTSLLGFYHYMETVSAPITSEPFTLQN